MKEMIRHTIRLCSYAKPVWFLLYPGVIAYAFMDLLITWFMASLLGDTTAALSAGNYSSVVSVLINSAPILAVILVLDMVCSYVVGKAEAKTIANMRSQVLKNQLNATLESSNKVHSGIKLSYIINDVPVAMGSLVSMLFIPASALTLGTASLIYIFTVDIRFSLLVIGMSALVLTYSVVFSSRMHAAVLKAQAAMARVTVYFKSLLDGIVTARMYKVVDVIDSELDVAATQAANEGVKRARAAAVMGASNSVFHRYGDKIFIFVAGLIFVSGKFEIDTVTKISQMAGGAMSVMFLSRVLIGVQSSLAGAKRIFEAMDSTDEEQNGTQSISVNPSDIAVQFKNVNFGYGNGRDFINGFDLSIQNGEFVAITGQSGIGKSTLLRMIQGLYNPTSGTIEVLGTNTLEWDKKALRSAVSLIPQESILFPGTIAENISIGTGINDMAEIESAAIAAGAHDFILDQPEGYNTQVSERGSSLSGGQVQRIAIARALLKKSPVLMLDEATSALDSASEEIIWQTLLNLKGKCTIIIVTHRMQTANIADRIVHIPSPVL